jgi:bifunctional non-homologous end joining protein LigD
MRPMLATSGGPGAPPPSGPDWVHEVKWDGMRVLADVADGRLRLTSRTEADVTVGFPELAGLVDAVADVHLDGELVALVDGVPSFSALAERMHVADARRAAALSRTRPVTYLAFDLLRLYGVPLLDRPFSERRATLERLDLPAHSGPWQVPGVFDDGAALLEATAAQGLEGILSKRRASRYQPGRRSRDWVKRAHRTSSTVVVGGWRPQVGGTDLAALLVGAPQPDGTLRYLGRVGSGIGPAAATVLTRLLAPLAEAAPPFADPLPRDDERGTTWVRPEVLVEVVHLGLAGGGRLRQPAYQGVRTDLKVDDLLAGDVGAD